MTYRARCDHRRLNARERNRRGHLVMFRGDSRREHDWASRMAALDPVLHPLPAAVVAEMDGLYRAAMAACRIHLLRGEE